MKPAFAFLAAFFFVGCFDAGDGDSSAAEPASAPPASPPAAVPEVKVTAASPALTKELVEALTARPIADLDYDKLDALVRKGIDEARGSIEDAIDKQDKIDYDRIHSLILQTVVDNLKPAEPPKYQFMCDSNERWIYRCDLQTGKIECFSMSDNKLRPLSSYP